MEKKGIIIAIDFDGTCVTHEFPKVGRGIGAEPVLRRLVEAGHKLILWTMRSNFEGNTLDDAVNWFKERDIPLWGVQENPEQSSWTHSPKAYAQLYIDDAALGCPLVKWDHTAERPYANWEVIEMELEHRGLLAREKTSDLDPVTPR